MRGDELVKKIHCGILVTEIFKYEPPRSETARYFFVIGIAWCLYRQSFLYFNSGLRFRGKSAWQSVIKNRNYPFMGCFFARRSAATTKQYGKLTETTFLFLDCFGDKAASQLFLQK
jgi:hypothetical protein